jgi:hypothetical protein
LKVNLLAVLVDKGDIDPVREVSQTILHNSSEGRLTPLQASEA